MKDNVKINIKLTYVLFTLYRSFLNVRFYVKKHLPLQSLIIAAIKIIAEANEDTTITANSVTTYASRSVLTFEVRNVDDIGEPVEDG